MWTHRQKTITNPRHNAQYISLNTSQTPAPPSKIQTWVNSCGGKRSCIGNDVMKFHGRLALGMFGAKVPRLSRTAIQISSRRQTGESYHTRTPLHTTTSPTELLQTPLKSARNPNPTFLLRTRNQAQAVLRWAGHHKSVAVFDVSYNHINPNRDTDVS